MSTVLLGVSGSISAYKAADIINLLKKQNIQTEVIMTQNSMQFITPLTLQVLSQRAVHYDVMREDTPGEINHIDLIKRADLFLVAPATANIIGKLANGIGDDMLSTTALVAHSLPKLIAPAMNTAMYLHPAQQRNLKLLKADGYHEIKPRETLLACGDYGVGALATPKDIVDAVMRHL